MHPVVTREIAGPNPVKTAILSLPMRNPCQTCERSLLDKNECSLGCQRRQEYCVHLGISVTGATPPLNLSHKKPRSCSSVVVEHPPYKGKVAGSVPARTTKLPKVPEVPKPPNLPKPPKLPRPSKPPKISKTCPTHPDRPALKYYRDCLECVNERTKKEVEAREERRQAKALKERLEALKPPYDWNAPRPMRSKAGRLGHATICIKNGKGNRETHRLTGMHTHTVAKLRKVLEEENGGPFLCSCGRPVVHKGMCSYRKVKTSNL